jgi:hypothetical protein
MNRRHHARLATSKEQGRQGFGEDYIQKMPMRLYTSCKGGYFTNIILWSLRLLYHSNLTNKLKLAS